MNLVSFLAMWALCAWFTYLLIRSEFRRIGSAWKRSDRVMALLWTNALGPFALLGVLVAQFFAWLCESPWGKQEAKW